MIGEGGSDLQGERIQRSHEHLLASLREFDRYRVTTSDDAQLEALRAAILLEELADIVLTDDLIDPAVLTDESAMAQVVRDIRQAR